MNRNQNLSESDTIQSLAGSAKEGDPQALGELFSRFSERLTQVIHFRMDRRLKSRIDASDIVQEAFVEATQRIAEYDGDKMPFFVWLRFITLQKLAQTHRHHLSVQARDAARDISINRQPNVQATSVVLAAQLLGGLTSPSHAAMRSENKLKLEKALAEMDEIDREVLALRHFEQLNNAEAANILDINESAASNRYVRALKRLKKLLDSLQSETGVI